MARPSGGSAVSLWCGAGALSSSPRRSARLTAVSSKPSTRVTGTSPKPRCSGGWRVWVGDRATAREFNFKRYHYQGIGRYESHEAYARGIADLSVLANLLPRSGYLFGEKANSIDAGIYGFVANICSYEIDTPLKEFVISQANLVAHCRLIQTEICAKLD